jgi:hypothetical protein
MRTACHSKPNVSPRDGAAGGPTGGFIRGASSPACTRTRRSSGGDVPVGAEDCFGYKLPENDFVCRLRTRRNTGRFSFADN